MGSRPQITHQQIVAYLQGSSDKETQEHVAKIREDDQVYHLLFDLIDDLKNQASIRKQPSGSTAVPLRFSAIEDMLMRILAGNPQPADAQRFIDALIFSPLFYQRLLVKLSAATPQIALDDVPEIAKVQVKTDDEILEEIVTGVKAPPVEIDDRGAVIKRLSCLVVDVWENQRLRYAFALLTIIAATLVTRYAPVIKTAILGEKYEYYVYDDRVPYPYDISSLRGVPPVFTGDALFQSFVTQFSLGMGDYMARKHERAIRVLETLEPTALALQAKATDKELLPWIRDLYFYLGLSHLALSMKKGLGAEVKTEHLDKSIQYLSRAQSQVLVHNLEGIDKETYFLGLAYGFGGRQGSAIAQLQKIEPGSRFYKDSVKLLKKWSE